MPKRRIVWLLAAAIGVVCFLNRYRSFEAEIPVFIPESGETVTLSVSVSERQNLFTKALEFRKGSVSFSCGKYPLTALYRMGL